MTHTHLFRGCRPEPLGRYLQGLGILRLIGEQADQAATGHWTDAGLVLTTSLTEAELIDFFLDRYAPTPMVSPWNKGAGLRRDGKSKAAELLIAKAEQSTLPRLKSLRSAIATARKISDAYPDDIAFVAKKEQIIARSRSQMPDAALAWIDAAVTLTGEGPVYPHILGTGGNLGRLDLTANLLSHLDRTIGLDGTADRTRSQASLVDALYGTQVAPRARASTGQYDPGNAGGVNTSTFDGGTALVNPWSFVLQLEGAILFASGIARRLGTDGGSVAAMPFTVRPSATGAGHLSHQENIKGELWVPLWAVPSTAAEVRRLFSESRLRWKGRIAGTGLDAARAVTTLGAERGVTAFSRNVIAERLGQNPLAVPAGRVAVRQRQAVALTGNLDRWLQTVRRLPNPPGAITTGLRAADDAIMAVTAGRDSGATDELHGLLEAVADLDATIRVNQTLRDALRPAPLLDASAWLPLLDDATAEFAVAWSVAASHEHVGDPRVREIRGASAFQTVWRPTVRDYIRGTRAGRNLLWAEGPAVETDVTRSPVQALCAIHVAHATNPRSIDDSSGEMTTMRSAPWVPREVIEAFAAGHLDDRRIGMLIRSLVLLGVPTADQHRLRPELAALAGREVVVPAWRLLVPVFHLQDLHDSVWIAPDRHWPSALARGSITTVLRGVLVRLRSRLGPIRSIDPQVLARNVDGTRLAASLFVTPSPSTLNRLVALLALDTDTTTQEENS